MAISTAATQPDQQGNEGLVEEIVSKVAETTNSDPLSLEPLYYTIDPDKIDIQGRVMFTYEGCEVLIDTAGEVQVFEAD